MTKRRSEKPARAAAAATSAKRKPAAGDVVVPAGMKPIVAAFAGSKQVSVEKGWGSNSVAIKVRGKIFAMLVRGDLVLKLPSARVDDLVQARGLARFDPRGDGRVMKEWLVLPLATRDRVGLAREACEFVAGGGK